MKVARAKTVRFSPAHKKETDQKLPDFDQFHWIWVGTDGFPIITETKENTA